MASPPPNAQQVVVSLDQPGPLGIRFKGVFVDGGREAMQVTGVNAGSQGARHPQLHPGLVLAWVQDGGNPAVNVGNFKYAGALKVVKSSGRPITLTFDEGRVAATP
jgi:hypothetical protein